MADFGGQSPSSPPPPQQQYQCFMNPVNRGTSNGLQGQTPPSPPQSRGMYKISVFAQSGGITQAQTPPFQHQRNATPPNGYMPNAFQGKLSPQYGQFAPNGITSPQHSPTFNRAFYANQCNVLNTGNSTNNISQQQQQQFYYIQPQNIEIAKWPADANSFWFYLNKNKGSDLLRCEWDPTIFSQMYSNSRCEEERNKLRALAASFTIKKLEYTNPTGTAVRCEMKPVLVPRKYGHTNIYFLNIDALHVASILHNSQTEDRIACLCLANEKVPGGSWVNGEEAQEGTLFTCTNLSRILAKDPELYPIREFECIYVNNAIALRDSRDFRFLHEEFPFNVVMCTGYDTSNKRVQFSPELRARLRAKIEVIFTSCLHNGVNTLVLEAFGCGKYGNPPADVAEVFRAVVEQYAGHFKSIYFAISDINTSYEFEKAFETAIHCKKYETPYGTVQSITLSAVNLSARDNRDVAPDVYLRAICPAAGLCKDFSHEHRSTHIHPPVCPRRSACKSSGRIHLEMYTHPPLCKGYAACPILFDDSMNPALIKEHREHFEHAPPCELLGSCPGLSDPKHMADFLHNPTIPNNGVNSVPKPTLFKTVRINDITPPPQKQPGGDSASDNTNSCYGCIRMCPDGDSCTDLSEEHNCAYRHSGSERKECELLWCRNGSAEHRHEYSHSLAKLPPLRVVMTNIRSPGSGRCAAEWDPDDIWHTDFVRNTSNALKMMIRYGKSKFADNVREVARWVRSLSPVVRISAAQFMGVLNIGRLCSSRMLEFMWEEPRDLIEAVLERPEIEKVLRDKSFNVVSSAEKYGRRFVEIKLPEKVKSLFDSDFKDRIEGMTKGPGLGIIKKYTIQSTDAERDLSSSRENLYHFLKRENVDEAFIGDYERSIEAVIDALIEEILQLKHRSTTENIVGVRDTIPAILGDLAARDPGFRDETLMDGSGEIAIVVRQELMFHPDFYLTLVRATLYPAAEYAASADGALRRPWVGKNRPWDMKGNEHFFRSKFHPSDPRWADVVAMDWILRVSLAERKDVSEVTFADVMSFLEKQRREHVPEAHLPQYIPMEYVENVVILNSTYDKIKAYASDGAKMMLDMLDEKGLITKCPPLETSTCGYCVYGGDASLRATPASETFGMRLENIPSKTLPGMHGFTFALAPKKEYFLPVALSYTTDTVHFAFSVCGGPFSVSLSDIGDTIPPNGIQPHAVTFHIGSKDVDTDEKDINAIIKSYEFESLRISNGTTRDSVNPMYKDLTFSKGVIKSTQTVHYVITADYKEKKFSISHWGPSAPRTKKVASVEMKFPDACYSYVSFMSYAVYGPQPVISNAREVLATSRFAPLYGLNGIIAGGAMDNNLYEAYELQIDHLHDDDDDSIDTKKLKSLPLCDDPFNCKEYRKYFKTMSVGDHVNEKSHICIYGKTCRYLNDEEHCLRNRHLMKDPCPDGDKCSKLRDPLHRLEFFHENKWDYLITCWYTGCTLKKDPEHCTKFCHGAPKYPKQTNFYEDEMR